jgi:hypothetical protein
VVGAGVVERADHILGEEVVAVVTMRAGATVSSDDLVAYARTQLAARPSPG